MKKYYIVFKNGVKFFILADSFTINAGKIRFARATVTIDDWIAESEVGAILEDGTTSTGLPLIG